MGDWPLKCILWQIKREKTILFLKIGMGKKPVEYYLLINETSGCFYEPPVLQERVLEHTPGIYKQGEMNSLSDSDKLSLDRKITP